MRRVASRLMEVEGASLGAGALLSVRSGRCGNRPGGCSARPRSRQKHQTTIRPLLSLEPWYGIAPTLSLKPTTLLGIDSDRGGMCAHEAHMPGDPRECRRHGENCRRLAAESRTVSRSEEHTSELQSLRHLVC